MLITPIDILKKVIPKNVAADLWYDNNWSSLTTLNDFLTVYHKEEAQ